ncbi:10356_t:CDS:2, partial [Diversispora eburnea]
FIELLLEGKISVKALIYTSSKFNTISKSLFDRLGMDHEIRPTCDLVKNLYKDVIAHEVKICFNSNAKIVINGMSIPLIDEDFNKASSSKNSSLKSDLLIEEITNMIKILSLRSEDNKQRKKYHGNIPPVSPTHRRVSKNKKYPKVDLGDGCGKLSLKTHLNNIWKSVHSIENDIEYGVFEKLRIIKYELSYINKAKLPWIKSETDPSNSCLHQNKSKKGPEGICKVTVVKK